ncbi:helix-turn-helix transcriptional regulator [Flavobacterium sp. SUN052]|uniref:AraC family transcriptional regulator n=1 Tax=Flavobacterium sp. SUN052 TaxID=3002441 RepID=UPI00237E3D3A|nr:helix-turn-helix transcriptional regulator [Flavobacterium sp. SUN052]MEC4005709.1 helix-turn-helix transcriptional regulator [Flavobacterium sp. SUN052]
MSKIPIYNIQNFNCETTHDDLYVNTFKNHLKNHDFIEKPHRHDFYLLVLFTEGSGIHEIDFDSYSIQKGSLFMIQPGQIHNWRLSKDIDGYIVFYSQDIYNLYFGNKTIEEYLFFKSTKSNPEILFDKEEFEEIKVYFELMLKENSFSKFKRNDKILNLLDTINIEISRKYNLENNHKTSIYNHKIDQFEKLIEKNYKIEKSPSFYASKMNITLKHLNRICKTILNQTVTNIITKRVVLEAKRLLVDKNKSISQVADELGFDNYAYFAKIFKKENGISAKEFRTGLNP